MFQTAIPPATRRRWSQETVQTTREVIEEVTPSPDVQELQQQVQELQEKLKEVSDELARKRARG